MRPGLAIAGLVLLLVGCGSATEADPLATRLAEVDAAAAADSLPELESAVDGLLAAVDDAATGGDLDQARARQIRVAARALLTAAGEEAPAPIDETGPTSTPPPEEQEAREDDDSDDDAAEADDDPDDDDDKTKAKAKTKDKTKKDKDD